MTGWSLRERGVRGGTALSGGESNSCAPLLQKVCRVGLLVLGPTDIVPESRLPIIALRECATALRGLDRVLGRGRPCSDTPEPFWDLLDDSLER
jgi:hypothetical protein